MAVLSGSQEVNSCRTKKISNGFLTMGEGAGLNSFFNASHVINRITEVCISNSYKMNPIQSLPKTAINHTWLYRHTYASVSCFLYFSKKTVTSTQENLYWIGQLSVYGAKASFPWTQFRSQNGDLEFAGAMNLIMSLRQVMSDYLSIVPLNCCFYVYSYYL